MVRNGTTSVSPTTEHNRNDVSKETIGTLEASYDRDPEDVPE
jgi:hypothetical protein